MRLIGAGLPRTGTLSQKVALEMLGFGPCYHMVNVLADLSLAPAWRAAFEGGSDWDAVFAGHEATVDWPGSFFYRELADYFPDAKVLLSVRDGASWEESIIETIWGVLYGDTLMKDLSSARVRVDPEWAGYIDLVGEMWQKSGLIPSDMSEIEPGSMARAMERHNAEVIATIPAERLLVWRPADGWEPLCEFLEVPVPEGPFPRLNDAKMFAERIVDAAIEVLVRWQAEQAPAS